MRLYPKRRRERARTWLSQGNSKSLSKTRVTSMLLTLLTIRLMRTGSKSKTMRGKSNRSISSKTVARSAWVRSNWWNCFRTLTSFQLTNRSNCSWSWKTDGTKNSKVKSRFSAATFTTFSQKTWPKPKSDLQIWPTTRRQMASQGWERTARTKRQSRA